MRALAVHQTGLEQESAAPSWRAARCRWTAGDGTGGARDIHSLSAIGPDPPATLRSNRRPPGGISVHPGTLPHQRHEARRIDPRLRSELYDDGAAFAVDAV